MNTFLNKTYAYLSHSLGGRPHLEKLINHFYGLYIDDKSYIAYEKCEDCLFFHTDIKSMNAIMNNYPSEVEDCYIYNNTGVLLFKLNLENKNWKSDFIKGNYSNIYSKKELLKYKTINLKVNINIRHVLTKDDRRWPKFKDQIFEIYGTNLEDYDQRELDLPPELKHEILNY